MSTRTVLAVAFAALQLAAVPAFAEGEGNGPGSPGSPAGAFGGWVVPVGMASARDAGAGSENYTQSPCYSEVFSVESAADVGSDPSLFAWPAMPLGGTGAATYARASGPRAPRG